MRHLKMILKLLVVWKKQCLSAANRYVYESVYMNRIFLVGKREVDPNSSEQNAREHDSSGNF